MNTIKQSSRELSKIEKYMMTASPAIISMKDVEDDTSIPVDAWVIFDDTKVDGESVEILSILSGKNVYSCQSQTFRRELLTIDAIMDGEHYAIIKLSGITNAGRPFITCTLDVDSVK